MRDSQKKELAWEFIRFCMEFPKSLFEPFYMTKYGDYEQAWSFPVNRNMFDDHLRKILNTSYETVSQYGQLQVASGSSAEINYKEQVEMVEYSLICYRELVEMLNTEGRSGQAVTLSLIYPDIYLFATDRQNAERTLQSIQNRLELYIAE